MPDLSVIIQWMGQYPLAGWGLLLLYIVAGIVRHRIINAESGSVFRGLLNFRRRRLEQMLTQPFLEKNEVMLARHELRQRSLYQLTGLFDNRLQPLAVKICHQNGLRAGYFRHWRGWLKEQQGRIIFDRPMYAFFYCLSLTAMLVITVMLVALSLIFYRQHGEDHLAIFIVSSGLLWWGPLLVLMALPSPKMTNEMEAFIASFNASADRG